MPVRVRELGIQKMRGMGEGSYARLVRTQNATRTIVKIHPNTPVRQRIPHPILITIIHPAHYKHLLLRQFFVVVRIRGTEHPPSGFRFECRSEDRSSRVETIEFRAGVGVAIRGVGVMCVCMCVENRFTRFPNRFRNELVR